MKCEHCGGFMIFEKGCFGNPDRMKCSNCGREPKRAKGLRPGAASGLEGGNEMEEKMKTCTHPKCNKELPATSEYFSRNKTTKDGLEYWCKACKKRAQADYRAQKAAGEGRHSIRKSPKKRPPVLERKTDPTPIITASPEAIVRALRTGVAVEMIQKIGEQYGLKVTVESM